MSEHSIDSLCEFLLHAGTDFRIYDIGRGVHPLSSQTFLQIENAENPAPNPRQGQAWFALVFWQASHAQLLHSARQYIWFLRLSVDEQSKVVHATRSHFLHLIIDALQRDPTLEEGLQDNPYIFAPSEVLRAQLSARIKADLNQHNEKELSSVNAYIAAPGAMDWRNLSTQSVHDACHLLVKDEEQVNKLQKNWALLSTPFKDTMLSALEVVNLPDTLSGFFIEKIHQSTSESDKARLLLALSSDEPSVIVKEMLVSLLSNPESASMDILSATAGRFGHALSPALLGLFFQRCIELDNAKHAEGEILKGFYQDLVYLPSIRQHVLRLLHQ